MYSGPRMVSASSAGRITTRSSRGWIWILGLALVAVDMDTPHDQVIDLTDRSSNAVNYCDVLYLSSNIGHALYRLICSVKYPGREIAVRDQIPNRRFTACENGGGLEGSVAPGSNKGV